MNSFFLVSTDKLEIDQKPAAHNVIGMMAVHAYRFNVTTPTSSRSHELHHTGCKTAETAGSVFMRSIEELNKGPKLAAHDAPVHSGAQMPVATSTNSAV
jgi:hypothetical protein